ncbi:MAG: UbiH/UbiF/VisC/COQ6 family ubiquinone biosynthesis hydroxylase [Coxiella endosymbiont of Dermacentor nuttalli]
MNVNKLSKVMPVTIIGGGMVGLLLAALLANAKIRVAIVEEKSPLLCWNKSSLDPRVSAINAVSGRLLKKLGFWQDIRKSAYSPLIKLNVWDSIGGGEIIFDSVEVCASALGAIVENREITRVLWQKLKENPLVEFICPEHPCSVSHSEEFIDLEFSSQKKVQTSLLVGADGSHSWLRNQMNIDIQESSYEQSAVVSVVKTENPHEQTGWETFLPDAVLALLPLANPHNCAIVWSVSPEKATQLMAIDEKSFNTEISHTSNLRLGKIHRLTQPKVVPLIMRYAKKYLDSRMVLIGDAAHTIHPLAGQGVNLGFMDAACLAQCIIDARYKKLDVGSVRVLRRYERWRKGDNLMMLAAMRFFKEFFGTQLSLIVQMRTMGLMMTNRLNFVKNCFIKIAMGEVFDLPDLIIR